MREKSQIQRSLDGLFMLESDLKNIQELIDMGEESGDAEVLDEVLPSLEELHKKAAQVRIECLFNGEVDGNDSYLEVNAGAGGTESHDWAEMLLRMYVRWAESHGFKADIMEKLTGEEAGIKSAMLKISGENAYGWLKSESGVHRLVRISPFNAMGKRQTSFASIWVMPIIDDSIEIEVVESDLRIDTFRASGAGGQHVNTTDSAVRMTHIPTGIVVQCQNDRSQHKNRDQCMSMLRSKLYELEMKKRQEVADAKNAQKSDIGWGNQIRSYVLHPYQMVKDLRTDHETSDTAGVLDGDLDGFMSAFLEKNAFGKGGAYKNG